MMKNLFPILFLALCCISCQEKEDNIQEITIIGGGLMGSTTAWQLSNYGEKVLLIEQQDSVYTFGSSYGEARIARSSNRGNDIWSYLHNRSVKEMQQLVNYLNSNSTDKSAFHISDIYTTSPVTYVGRTTIYDKLYKSLIRQKVDYKMAVNPEEGEKLFDANLPDSVLMQVEYNEHSGMINPRKVINFCQKGVLKKGNNIWYNHKVINILQKENHYEIEVENTKTGEKQTIKSKKVISAAGPYTGTLLKNVAPYFDDLINPQKIGRAHV